MRAWRNMTLKSLLHLRPIAQLVAIALLVLSAAPSPAQTNEFRGLWVDAFHEGLKTPTQISKLLKETRAANFNALVVQLRRRGDVLYNSAIEPKAADVSSDFDPLADLITKAHDSANGARIEVHAWIVVYPVWNNETKLPPTTNHIF